MPTPDDLPAAEAFSIIEEPPTEKGPIHTILLKLIEPFSRHLDPGRTRAVVVARASGKKMRRLDTDGKVMLEQMQADLATMSAREFSNRYLDL